MSTLIDRLLRREPDPRGGLVITWDATDQPPAPAGPPTTDAQEGTQC